MVTSLTFSPDSQHFVSTSFDLVDVFVCQWDVHGIWCAMFMGALHRPHVIAPGCFDNSVRLWDAQSFHPPLGVLATHLVAFSPQANGRRLAISTPSRGQGHDHHVLDVDLGKLHRRLDNAEPDHACSELSAASFDPGSMPRLVATRNPPQVAGDVESGQKMLVLGDGYPSATAVAFSHADGRLVVTAAYNGGLKLSNADVGVELCSLNLGHRNPVGKVVFSLCGRYIAAASDAGRVRLWSIGRRGGSMVATFSDSEHEVKLCQVAFSGDGKALWSGDYHGVVSMRRICDIVSDEQER
uniref:Transcriptional repressor rco-1 n=1 Tax=Ganoderma boninense TaxID=34458 RepID=A0A5K1JRN3_9APHY|nr:Transcriptional repressor rco-1 [Ganoderma boninense]